MHRRHLADAVAVVFIGGAQGHIPAGDMGNGDMPRCRCRGYGKNLKAVAQYQQAVGGALGKIFVKYRQRAGNSLRHRLGGIVGKNGQPGVYGKAVLFDFGHRLTQPWAKVRPGHDQPQLQIGACRQFLYDRTQ